MAAVTAAESSNSAARPHLRYDESAAPTALSYRPGRGIRHTRIIREPIKSAQRARRRRARELQHVLGLRVVSEAVDCYRHCVADKLIAGLQEGVAPRLLAVLIWGHDVIDERIVEPLRNFMAQSVYVLDRRGEDVSANKKVCSTTLLPCAPVTGASR
jgi:hypothetical protein